MRRSRTRAPAPPRAHAGGRRILEFEREIAGSDHSRSGGQLSVQLWDVSGDQKFEGCWPAIIKDAVGVVLVYDPDKSAQEHEAELWHEWFVKNPGLDDRQCLVFAHRAASGTRPRPRELPAAAALACATPRR